MSQLLWTPFSQRNQWARKTRRGKRPKMKGRMKHESYPRMMVEGLVEQLNTLEEYSEEQLADMDIFCVWLLIKPPVAVTQRSLEAFCVANVGQNQRL
uniref:Uncharacterized protein n=1 Tax=Ditylenchus dipsaci TaxID=166011 RepID=A0A915D718_9BILA